MPSDGVSQDRNITHAEASHVGAPGARDLAKQDLARRLSKALQDRDWNQSDLARASELPREVISTYVRGISFPTPKSLRRMSDALGIPVDQLAPAAAGMAAQDEIPAFSVTQLQGHPGKAWLRVNQVVPFSIAMKIGELLESMEHEGVGND